MNKHTITKKGQALNRMVQGQVLVLVLITMMVLAIILISVVNNAIKDSNLTRSNVIYETLYAIAEKNTIDIVHSFKDVFINLDKNSLISHLQSLGYDPADFTCDVNPTRNECILCEFKDEATQKYFANQYGENGQSVVMNVCDSKNLESIETSNGNHTFFNLIGSGEDVAGNPVDKFKFEVTWAALAGKSIPNFAMEAILDIKFRDVSGQVQYTSLRGVYKNNSMKFPELIEDQSPNAEYFKIDDLGAEGMTFVVDKKKIESILKNEGAVTSYARYLANNDDPALEFVGARFKPIYDNGKDDDVLKISVRALDVFGNPLDNVSQSRFVQTTVFVRDADDPNAGIEGSQASVETGIPLYQPPGIFDYILRSEEQLYSNLTP